MISIIRR